MHELLASALGTAEVIGRRGELVLYRWQDPSGARLVMCTEGAAIVDFLPSFAAEPGARLAGVRAANEDVAVADVVDDGGEVVTRLAAEFEQRRQLPAGPVGGRASIVALGVQATVHASEDDFAASDASLLGGAEEPGEPPAHFLENGWQWPPRMAAESFISYGVFNAGETAEAYARLNGVVLAADVRTVAATGQRFVAARVRCAGFEATVCLPADEHTTAPRPGAVIAGTMFLTASLPGLALPQEEPRRRFGLPWKRSRR
ncbi:MAG TPA: hypothetical protein VL738_05590 [Dactylosporangium sp.]|nr:hypothetical protein [Dactylosporangium sp.]